MTFAYSETVIFTPDEQQYIIGDKAYPNLPWCIAPYINRGNLTAAQVYFNIVHAKTRQVIERSSALLFGRFRRLKFFDMNNTKLIPATVVAACVLHNVCLDFHDLHLDEYIQNGINYVADNNDNRVAENVAVEGRRRCEALCQQVFNAERN